MVVPDPRVPAHQRRPAGSDVSPAIPGGGTNASAGSGGGGAADFSVIRSAVKARCVRDDDNRVNATCVERLSKSQKSHGGSMHLASNEFDGKPGRGRLLAPEHSVPTAGPHSGPVRSRRGRVHDRPRGGGTVWRSGASTIGVSQTDRSSLMSSISLRLEKVRDRVPAPGDEL
jgi:hypothetical protein